MNYAPVTPAKGLMFAVMILGWLTCDHFGWDDRFLAQYAEAGAAPSASPAGDVP